MMVGKRTVSFISVNDQNCFQNRKVDSDDEGMDAHLLTLSGFSNTRCYNVTKKSIRRWTHQGVLFLVLWLVNGQDIEAREAMMIPLGGMSTMLVWAMFIMAPPTWGAVYNLPHGVCCAISLAPVVEREKCQACAEAFRNVRALGLPCWGKQTRNQCWLMLLLRVKSVWKHWCSRNSLNSRSREKDLTLTTLQCFDWRLCTWNHIS